MAPPSERTGAVTGRLFDVEDPAEAGNTDAWYTPPWIFEGMGIGFHVDVAAPLVAVPWLPADDHFNVNDDGLAQPWHGIVWCNPPYSDAGPWCRRWAEHPDGVLLIRQDFSTAGGTAAFAAASSLYVPAGRVAFVNAHADQAESRPSFSTVLLGRGAVCDEALERLALSKGGTTRRLQ